MTVTPRHIDEVQSFESVGDESQIDAGQGWSKIIDNSTSRRNSTQNTTLFDRPSFNKGSLQVDIPKETKGQKLEL